MKRKIKIKWLGKTVESEINVRDEKHLEAQIKYPSKVETPKKGKGSYKRNNKISQNELD